jgi:Glycosyl hydrolase family 45/Fungal cellulose binding domain
MTVMKFVSILWLFSLFSFVTFCSAQLTGTARTTRYWDSCAASCVWNNKADFASLLQSVTKSGAVSTDKNGPSGCISTAPNARFADPKQQPIVVNENLALGYAAAGSLNGLDERELCCSCMELTFTSGPVSGKRMVVQVINTGSDLGYNHFDLQIPGGGVGIFTEGVKNQFGPNYNFGNQYGGVSSMAECSGLPAILHPGCRWRFDWFKNADNPTVTFRQVQCPKQLTDVSKCIRADAGTKNLPVAAQTVPTAPVKPSANAVCPNKQGQQCGGKNFKGNTCCPSGMQCKYVEVYWSNCQPVFQPASSGPNVAVGPVQQQQCSNAKYSQCGGKDFTGQQCCQSGSTCKFINEWYHQCL